MDARDADFRKALRAHLLTTNALHTVTLIAAEVSAIVAEGNVGSKEERADLREVSAVLAPLALKLSK